MVDDDLNPKDTPEIEETATTAVVAGDHTTEASGELVDVARVEARLPGSTSSAPPTRGSRDWRRILKKAISFAAALFLFILAIQLMKTGAKAVAPSIRGTFFFTNGVSTLGFGWISAYIVLSGSPVAATALSLFDGHVITPLQTLTMITGSRLGASFIVLLTGFLYALRNRGRNRGESIGMGIQALSLTAIVYLPALVIGYWLLKGGALEGIHWHASSDVLSLVDYIWGPIEDFLYNLVPGYVASADGHPELWVALPAGLGVLLLSFKLLDSVLPQLAGERHADARMQWLKRPWPMFLLGCLVATLTLSVSVALTVLVPLASKGYVKRKEAIPYIMGANIMTLADTLVFAMLTGNAEAVQIVFAQGIGVAIVTIVFLAFLYRPISDGVMALDHWVAVSNGRLAGFVACLFLIPVLLLTAGIWLGPILR